MKKPDGFNFIISIILFLVVFLIGLVFLLNLWWWLGIVLSLASLAPLESYWNEANP